MGHFQVTFSLCVKTSLNPIHMKVSSAYRFILVQLQLHKIGFARVVLKQAQSNSGMAHCDETRYSFSDFSYLVSSRWWKTNAKRDLILLDVLKTPLGFSSLIFRMYAQINYPFYTANCNSGLLALLPTHIFWFR